MFVCVCGVLWCDQGTLKELPQTYRVQAIRSVTIRENGAWNRNTSSHQTPQACGAFVLKEEDVRDYFRSAARIPPSLHGYLPSSSCYAAGDIVFASGASGTWYIDSWRRGELTLGDGRKAYFYGLKARAGVFATADPDYARPSESAPSKGSTKADLTAITSISVRRDSFQWAVSEDQRDGLCRFELDEREAKDYFLRARQVPLAVYGSMSPSPCHAEGTLALSDGRVGNWMIERNRRGVLDLKPDGRIYLFGKDAQAPGFDPP